jgi:signal transduction histidine kinase
LSIVALAVSVVLQTYRDRIVMARLDDMSRPIYVQVRSLARAQATFSEVWENLKEQAQRNNVYILLLNNQGSIIRQALPRQGIKPLELPPGALPRSVSRPAHGTFETQKGQSFIYAAYPVGGLFGPREPRPETFILTVPRAGALAIWASLVRPLLYVGLIALVISVIIAIFLARSIYRPIQRVKEAADKIAQGQYDQEIPVSGPKEVKGLAIGFNQMAGQVKRSQQQLRHFVADVSHQLKSPLTSIRGFAQAMLDGTAEDNDARVKAAEIIEGESRRMLRQVDELLELSRMQSGQMKMAREPVDVKELLEHCREIFAIRAEEKGLNIRIEAEPLEPVTGDFDRLEQVFCNLLDNAIKNSPAGDEISITARRAGDFIQVKVHDNGPGIPPEQIPYIFERFYQAGGLRTGTGLGLAIAKEIILAHGGEIKADSAPGEGTEFIVRLPMGSATSPQVRSHSPAS